MVSEIREKAGGCADEDDELMSGRDGCEIQAQLSERQLDDVLHPGKVWEAGREPGALGMW